MEITNRGNNGFFEFVRKKDGKKPMHYSIDKKNNNLMSINKWYIGKDGNRGTLQMTQYIGNGDNTHNFKIRGYDFDKMEDCMPVGGCARGSMHLSEEYWGENINNSQNSILIKAWHYPSKSGNLRRICFDGNFENYKKLEFNSKTGLVTRCKGDEMIEPLFKYNYRTGKISELNNIEQSKAEEMVKFAKDQYKLYQKAVKTKYREVTY